MARYKFMGDEMSFENAHPDYLLDILHGDEFVLNKVGTKYTVYHASEMTIPFSLTAKEAKALLKESEEALNIEPDPNNPPYLRYSPKFEIIPLFYEHYNKTLFNGKCPVVTFKRTRDPKVFGLAKLEWHRGKALYTMLINETSMMDIKLFTNTVVHEMIHLYLYAKGIREGDNDTVMAAHGPIFQKEMHRINEKGFRIEIVASGETYETEASEKLYAIVVESGHKNSNKTIAGQCFFSRVCMSEQFDEFVSAFTLVNPTMYGAKIKLIETSDLRVAKFTPFPKSGKIPTSKLSKWYVLDETFKGRILKEIVTEGNDQKIPDYKEDPDAYCLPFDEFCRRMDRFGASRQLMHAKWKKFPLRSLNKFMEEEIRVIAGRIARKSISEPDIHNKLLDIAACYGERLEEKAYKDTLQKLLEKSDPKQVLLPYYSTLRLNGY